MAAIGAGQPEDALDDFHRIADSRLLDANRPVVCCVMAPAEMRLVREPISRGDLRVIAEAGFGDIVNAVVDVARSVMAIGGELHSDEEALLLDDGSLQPDLWGINLYPAEPGADWIEFDSMINVRPSRGNRSGSVDDAALRERIRIVVERLVAG